MTSRQWEAPLAAMPMEGAALEAALAASTHRDQDPTVQLVVHAAATHAVAASTVVVVKRHKVSVADEVAGYGRR